MYTYFLSQFTANMTQTFHAIKAHRLQSSIAQHFCDLSIFLLIFFEDQFAFLWFIFILSTTSIFSSFSFIFRHFARTILLLLSLWIPYNFLMICHHTKSCLRIFALFAIAYYWVLRVCQMHIPDQCGNVLSVYWMACKKSAGERNRSDGSRSFSQYWMNTLIDSLIVVFFHWTTLNVCFDIFHEPAKNSKFTVSMLEICLLRIKKKQILDSNHISMYICFLNFSMESVSVTIVTHRPTHIIVLICTLYMCTCAHIQYTLHTAAHMY